MDCRNLVLGIAAAVIASKTLAVDDVWQTDITKQRKGELSNEMSIINLVGSLFEPESGMDVHRVLMRDPGLAMRNFSDGQFDWHDAISYSLLKSNITLPLLAGEVRRGYQNGLPVSPLRIQELMAVIAARQNREENNISKFGAGFGHIDKINEIKGIGSLLQMACISATCLFTNEIFSKVAEQLNKEAFTSYKLAANRAADVLEKFGDSTLNKRFSILLDQNLQRKYVVTDLVSPTSLFISSFQTGEMIFNFEEGWNITSMRPIFSAKDGVLDGKKQVVSLSVGTTRGKSIKGIE